MLVCDRDAAVRCGRTKGTGEAGRGSATVRGDGNSKAAMRSGAERARQRERERERRDRPGLPGTARRAGSAAPLPEPRSRPGPPGGRHRRYSPIPANAGATGPPRACPAPPAPSRGRSRTARSAIPPHRAGPGWLPAAVPGLPAPTSNGRAAPAPGIEQRAAQ